MAIYIDTLPYLKTMQKKLSFPKGNPPTYGNLIFLLSESIKDSIKMINNTTISHDNKYYYYYYTMQYRGVLNNRGYNIRDLDGRLSAYTEIDKKTTLHPYPLRPLDSSQTRNTYFEMANYIKIFNKMTASMPTIKKIEAYWNYLRNIINLP